MPILVVGGAADAEALRATEEIRRRRGGVYHLDTAGFPAEVVIASRNGVWYVNQKAIRPPRVAYLRGLASHPLLPDLHDELMARPRGLVAQIGEKRALLESFAKHLESRGTLLVNPLEASAQHARKPYQLELLKAAGLPVPRWLATNDPQAVRRFVRDVGRAVYKPLAGGATVRILGKADLTKDRLSALANAPVLFQKLAEGVSVRVYVIGRRAIAAAEIHSPEIDYRRQEDRVESTKLTPDERRAACTAARACGMHFTGVDLIRGPRGFKVLECNPSPMFAVFERKTGADIAGPLAEFLLRKSKRP